MNDQNTPYIPNIPTAPIAAKPLPPTTGQVSSGVRWVTQPITVNETSGQTQPTFATAQVPAQEKLIPAANREQLEEKAKVLIAEIDKNHPPIKPKSASVAMKSVLAVLVMGLLVGGGVAGMKLIQTPGSQELGSQASVSIEPDDGTRRILANGKCSDGNDPRDYGPSHANGIGCRGTDEGVIYYYHCPDSATVANGCQQNGQTLRGQVLKTFEKDCGVEQIDLPGDHDFISVWHNEDCKNACNGTCGDSSDCQSGLECSGGVCRNPSCLGEEDCECQAQPLTCSAIGYGNNNPNFGQTVTLTCAGLPSDRVSRAEFQVAVAGGAWEEVVVNAGGKTADLVIDRVGNYKVRCRVCENDTAGSCTAWQEAGQ